jgi:uncharacterized tellurite resistance protein B-like protein
VLSSIVATSGRLAIIQHSGYISLIKKVIAKMPLIIWGSRTIFSTQGTGQFLCPRCNQTRSYKLQTARRFFTLYFIPLIPLETLGEFVECQACRTQYKPVVLNYSQANTKRFASELNVAIKRVLAMMILADGEPQDKEIEAMHMIYNRITSSDLSLDEIREEIAFAKADSRAVRHVLGNYGGSLNPAGKNLIIEAAYLVAVADGELKEEERIILNSIASIMQLTSSQVQDIIQRLAQP